jgi:hypothetical protein
VDLKTADIVVASGVAGTLGVRACAALRAEPREAG